MTAVTSTGGRVVCCDCREPVQRLEMGVGYAPRAQPCGHEAGITFEYDEVPA